MHFNRGKGIVDEMNVTELYMDGSVVEFVVNFSMELIYLLKRIAMSLSGHANMLSTYIEKGLSNAELFE